MHESPVSTKLPAGDSCVFSQRRGASEKAYRVNKLNPKAYIGTSRGEVCLQHKAYA